jgi:hypothetical protein
MRCSMGERSDGIPLCEICGRRPATHSVPRGPRNEGHLWVCDKCNPFLEKADQQ